MNTLIPKISVIVICYKQEDTIRRAIDSLLCQKDYIYEICVSDDCSPDGTWDILEEYNRQYPGLFKLHRNPKNVGIFKNIEYSWTMPTGEIITRLSGDDECGAGWYKTVVEYIQKNNIDYKNELFCIYGDYMQVNPNGNSIRYSNKLVSSEQINPLKLKIRQLLCNRSSCYSAKVLQRFVKVSNGRSYDVEQMLDSQLQIFSDKNYYIPYVGNIYYAGIGISVNMPSKDKVDSFIRVYDKLLDFCKTKNITVDKKDISYRSFMKAYRYWGLYKRFSDFTLMFKWYIKSIDFSLGFYGLQMDRIWFAFNRRISRK